MIIRKKQNWFLMLFTWRGSVLPEILPRLIALFLISSTVVFFQGELFNYKIPLNTAPFTLIGLALAIFLGFCNNASYDRYWEARKLWGGLLIDARSLARQVLTLNKEEADYEHVYSFVQLLIAFTYALKHQLRSTDPTIDLERLVPADFLLTLKTVRFKPAIIILELGKWLQKSKQEDKIDTIIQAAIDNNLNRLSEILGGCERIANTPIPYTYSVLLHRTIYIYCFLLPFGLIDSIGWMTPFIVTFIGYTFIALDAIVTQIEEPFGLEKNDLALNSMCQTIESSLLEMLGKDISSFKVNENKYMVD